MFALSLVFCFLLGGVVWGVGAVLSSKGEVDKEKGGAYECGFESFVMARVPFSLQFFLVCVIFLIFDVEIVLMLPLVLVFDYGLFLFFLFLLFVWILLLGLYFEWKEGSLEWVS
uniref:NADH-ubiquinone oxidoreductase chain 3 n=1 Tax=Centruroides limpidus TaxID=6876 RepID=Q5G798_CENLI|nr:NADH dehydrogenase subunit 3 [Centruroides limpidus]AAV53588.1 NADH dehydrogenase subunit 3 [Centruroides limpidus]